ncbi:MAG: hypothetical protein GKR89_17905 [Candidatus Latescibacteria bacterium]|nr:hypothetical protein [Candidatus Latescibacterota bacterium]
MRGYGVWCAFLVVFCAAYIYALFGDMELPGYWPLERAWRWGTTGGGPSIGWYAKVVWAGMAGLLAGAVSYGLGRFWPGLWVPWLNWIVLGVALAALGIAAHREWTHWGLW